MKGKRNGFRHCWLLGLVALFLASSSSSIAGSAECGKVLKDAEYSYLWPVLNLPYDMLCVETLFHDEAVTSMTEKSFQIQNAWPNRYRLEGYLTLENDGWNEDYRKEFFSTRLYYSVIDGNGKRLADGYFETVSEVASTQAQLAHFQVKNQGDRHLFRYVIDFDVLRPTNVSITLRLEPGKAKGRVGKSKKERRSIFDLTWLWMDRHRIYGDCQLIGANVSRLAAREQYVARIGDILKGHPEGSCLDYAGLRKMLLMEERTIAHSIAELERINWGSDPQVELVIRFLRGLSILKSHSEFSDWSVDMVEDAPDLLLSSVKRAKSRGRITWIQASYLQMLGEVFQGDRCLSEPEALGEQIFDAYNNFVSESVTLSPREIYFLHKRSALMAFLNPIDPELTKRCFELGARTGPTGW